MPFVASSDNGSSAPGAVESCATATLVTAPTHTTSAKTLLAMCRNTSPRSEISEKLALRRWCFGSSGRTKQIVSLDDFVDAHGSSAKLRNLHARGEICYHRRLGWSAAGGQHRRQISRDGVARANHIVYLARGRGYSSHLSVGRDQRHAGLAKRQQQMFDSQTLDRLRQRLWVK